MQILNLLFFFFAKLWKYCDDKSPNSTKCIFSTNYFLIIIFFITDSNYRFSKLPKQTSFCKILGFFAL